MPRRETTFGHHNVAHKYSFFFLILRIIFLLRIISNRVYISHCLANFALFLFQKLCPVAKIMKAGGISTWKLSTGTFWGKIFLWLSSKLTRTKDTFVPQYLNNPLDF